MTPNLSISLAAALSLLLLAGAFGFQHIGGLDPCELCIWQRWPHAIALGIGCWSLLSVSRIPPLTGAATLIIGAGVAFYHVGVEQGVFLGLETCSSGSLGDLTGAQLLDFTSNENLPQGCGIVAWSMLGLSMAAWNGIFCIIAAALWARGAIARR